MNDYRECLIVVIVLFCSNLHAMEDRYLAAVDTAHRRVPSADAVHERPSFSEMAHMQHLRDELTSSGGYAFAQERSATRSRSNSALLRPVIEIDSFEVHRVNDSSEDTGAESGCEGSDFLSDESSAEDGIAMGDMPAPRGNGGLALGSKSSDEDENSVSSNENAAGIASLHTPSRGSDSDPIATPYFSDENFSFCGLIDSSDSDNDSSGGSVSQGSPSQRPIHYHGATPSVATKTIPYGKLAGCAIGAYIIYNVVDSLFSQFKQERARKKNNQERSRKKKWTSYSSLNN